MDVEIVRLKAINDRRDFADASVAKLQNHHAGGWVFIFGKIIVRGTRRSARDGFHFAAHAKQKRVHGVATSRKKAAAARVLFGVPTELPIPRANAVKVIDFTVMNFAEQAAIDDGFRRKKLARVTAF